MSLCHTPQEDRFRSTLMVNKDLYLILILMRNAILKIF